LQCNGAERYALQRAQKWGVGAMGSGHPLIAIMPPTQRVPRRGAVRDNGLSGPPATGFHPWSPSARDQGHPAFIDSHSSSKKRSMNGAQFHLSWVGTTGGRLATEKTPPRARGYADGARGLFGWSGAGSFQPKLVDAGQTDQDDKTCWGLPCRKSQKRDLGQAAPGESNLAKGHDIP